MSDWQVEAARESLDKIMDLALEGNPQRISQEGQVVVVVSESDYQRLSARKKTFKEHLLSGPDLSDLDLTRGEDYMRDDEDHERDIAP